MRALFTLLHRYVGLFIALFLVFSGVTGAVISWDHELDDWLNPHLTHAPATGSESAVARPTPLQIAKQIEQTYPEIQVTYLPVAVEAGESLAFGVDPKQNPATGRLYEPGFNQVFVDPATGGELGKREWGQVWPITKETFVSFLYKLHYSLHLPELWGIDHWGIWLLGGIAILWTLDSFVGFYLTLPTKRRAAAKTTAKINDETADDASATSAKSWWRRWQPAWKVRWAGGSAKLNFDLHRAFSLWTWGLLFIVAFTAFSLNLYREVFYPIMSTVSKVTPSPFDLRQRSPKHEPITPKLGFEQVMATAQAEAQARGWKEPIGSGFYSENFGIYAVQFYHAEDGHGAGGVGHKRLYYDAMDGRYLGDRQPWQGTMADIFVQAQFPLHSGRILGLPGRILISVMGIVVAMLSITGVVIWWRKRASRRGYAGQQVRRSALV